MSMRSRVVRTLLLTAGLLSAIALPAQKPAGRLLRLPAATESRIALAENSTGHHAHAEAMGQLPAETDLTGMSLVLKPTPQQDADLTRLLSEQQNPASENFHQWLTPEQFGDRFGLSDGDIFLLQSWLQSHGFLVESVAESRNRIVFTGTVSAVEAAFRVHMQRYRRDGKTFFENSDSVQLPASLAAVVSSVQGLSSYRLTAPQAKRSVSAQSAVSPQYTTSTGSHYLVPWDLRQIYGTNTLIGSGFDGTGIKIGIIGQSAVDTTQITYFQQKTGQTVTLPTMVLVPNTGISNRVSGDEGESELDIEYASGNAPGAAVQFIYTGCTNTVSSTVLSATVNCNNNGVFDSLSYAVTKNLAPILSLSYGGCEEENAPYANSTLEPILRQANVQGQSIMVSSGDSGAASCESSASARIATAGLAVSYPASSPYVTGVGGTQLNGDASNYWSSANNSFLGSATGYIPEVAWNDTVSGGVLLSSGGGVSQIFSKPTWQVGTGVPVDGKRDVPDIAFPASVSQHAYLTCDVDGPCTSGAKSFTPTGTPRDGGGVGGTSAAAPTFAGMLAIVEQANGGTALGNINPSLYALAQGTSGSSVFHDIATGSNMVACTLGTASCTTGRFGYTTTVGYDLVTGLGSIAVPALQSALAGYAAKTPRIQITTSAATPTAGTAVTFTTTVTGGGTSSPSGSVIFSVDGTAVSPAVTLASGSATYSYSGFTSIGSHTVSVAYAGDANYSSGSASIAITALIVKPAITLTATPTSAAMNTSITLTVTLASSAGTPSGTVLFGTETAASGPVTLVNGEATYSFAGFATAGLHVVTATYTPVTTGPTASIYQAVQASANVVITGSAQTLKPTLQVTASPTSVAPGGSLTLLAQATGTAAAPSGNLQFLVDGAVASTASLSAGSATVSMTAPTTVGSHTVQINYYGDATYLSASAGTTFTVVNPGISVSVGSSTLTVAYGNTVGSTVAVASTTGASGLTSVTLSLVSYTGAAFTGCYNLAPNVLSLPANGTASAALTLYTTASSCSSSGLQPLSAVAAMSEPPAGPRHPGRIAWALLPASMLSLLLFRRRMRPAALLLMLMAVGSFGLSGCGSGTSSTTTTTTGTGTGTTTPTASSSTGSYVIRVTATTTGTPTLTSTTTFTLNVQ